MPPLTFAIHFVSDLSEIKILLDLMLSCLDDFKCSLPIDYDRNPYWLLHALATMRINTLLYLSIKPEPYTH